MDVEEFRRRGHELIDWIADYRQSVSRSERPVMSRVPPGMVTKQLPASPPESPESFDAIRRDLDNIILPACTQWQDPRFFAFFPSNSSLAAVLGDYVSTGLGQLGLNWQASPALTELEEVTTDWLRQMLGLSSHWSGVIQDAASTATLVALICARERATAYLAATGGLQASDRPLMIYATSQSHSSVEKAATLAGFGRDNLRSIDLDADFQMRPDALDRAAREDIANGLQPCAVVATSGTTAAAAFDPLAQIAQVARAHGLWMHVDAGLGAKDQRLRESLSFACHARWEMDGARGARR